MKLRRIISDHAPLAVYSLQLNNQTISLLMKSKESISDFYIFYCISTRFCDTSCLTLICMNSYLHSNKVSKMYLSKFLSPSGSALISKMVRNLPLSYNSKLKSSTSMMYMFIQVLILQGKDTNT